MRILFALLLAVASLTADTVVNIINRGHVMTQPRIHFIFWGSYWSGDGSPLADLVVRSYSNVSPVYFTGLTQYGVNTPQLAGMTIATLYEPPSYVTQLEAALLLNNLKKERIIRPAGEYFVLLLPKGITSPYRGYHTYLREEDGRTVWFSWVTTNSNTTITDVFHELVEGITDPEGRGVQTTVPVKSPLNWSEIADVCEVSLYPPATINDVLVPAYWSQADGACITPGAKVPAATRQRPSLPPLPGLPVPVVGYPPETSATP